MALKTIQETLAPLSPLSLNSLAINPGFEPDGPEDADVYVIIASPSMIEDRTGEPFSSQGTSYFKQQLPDWLKPRVRYNYVVGTWLRDEKTGSRDPNKQEIEAFRADLLLDILKTNPKVIITLDNASQSVVLPGIGNTMAARGKKFPVNLGGCKTWVCPIMSPALIKKVSDFRWGDIPGTEQKRVWVADIKRAISIIDNFVAPEVITKEDLLSNVEVSTSVDEVLHLLDKVAASNTFAFDIETSKLRPYYSGARIVTIAFAYEKDGRYEAGAFPLDWKTDEWKGWNDKDRKLIISKLTELFTVRPNQLKIAHNLPFEMEWMSVYLNDSSIPHKNMWADTESESFVLDERPGSHNLGAVTSEYLGINVKSLSNINVKKIETNSLDDVLVYNALDSLSTLIVHYKLVEQINKEKLNPILQEHIDRIPTLVKAQIKGLLVDQTVVAAYQAKLGGQIDKVLLDIQSTEEAKAYEEVFAQPYMPSSPQRTAKLFKNILGVSLVNDKKKASTDKTALKRVSKDFPIAKKLLQFRELSKLKSTYVDSLSVNAPEKKRHVHGDLRIHPEFKSTRTVTGRLSSSSPNCQNIPSRKNKDIRSQIVPDPGCVFVACDYAQIEARCIAMASNDTFLFKATLEGYDIHAEWANKVIEYHPKVFESRGSDFKAFRSQIKNELVFPLFYGSQPDALSLRLGITDAAAKKLFDEFWRKFPGVLVWQQKLMKAYKTLGYVETLTGRRRHAPISANMVYNSCIQGSSSDIVVKAMNHLADLAVSLNMPGLQAVLNIHDDLTFCVPEAELEVYLETITKEMVRKTYDWITLPLEVEISVGNNWADMTQIAKVNTLDYVY